MTPDERSEEPMTPDEYHGRCRSIVISVSRGLDPDDVGWAMHLIDHGEAPEGMASLAWSLDDLGGGIDQEIAAELNELISGLVPVASLPPSLWQVVPEADLPVQFPWAEDCSYQVE